MKFKDHEGPKSNPLVPASRTELQTSSLWDQLRDAVDGNRRWISACLNSIFFLLLIALKQNIPDHRINRISRQEDIPQRVYERRKELMGIVFAVGQQGRAYPETSSAAAAAAAAVPNEPQDGTVRSAGDSCNPSAISPACIAAMKRLLIGRRVYFVPVEADVGFVRANIKFRNGFFFKKDLAAYLVSQGLATTSEDSFSSLRPPPGPSSPIHYLRLHIHHRRLQRLERAAVSRQVGMWSHSTNRIHSEQFAWSRGPSYVVKRAFACMRSLWRAGRRM